MNGLLNDFQNTAWNFCWFSKPSTLAPEIKILGYELKTFRRTFQS